MKTKYFLYSVVLLTVSSSFAESDFETIKAKFDSSKAAISYKDVPTKSDPTLTCVFVSKKEPNKTILDRKLFRIEKNLPPSDPVLGPKSLTFAADPFFQKFFNDNGEDAFKKIQSKATVSALFTSVDDKTTEKVDENKKTNHTRIQIQLEIRKHSDGYFTLQSKHNYKFDGWSLEKEWNGCQYMTEGRCVGAWEYDWKKSSSNQETLWVGYCWIPKT